MPFVRIQLMEGRTPEQKAELAKAIIAKMEELHFADPAAVHVIYEDMAAEDYHRGQKQEQ